MRYFMTLAFLLFLIGSVPRRRVSASSADVVPVQYSDDAVEESSSSSTTEKLPQKKVDFLVNPDDPQKITVVETDVENNIMNVTIKDAAKTQMNNHETGVARFIKGIGHGIKNFFTKTWQFLSGLFSKK